MIGRAMPKRPTAYLAGAMENAKSLGAGWRNEITPKLVELGYDILNPCLFEPEQLKGLHTSRLPESLETQNGKSMTPKHWHELKYAKRSSSMYQRFTKYMRRIIRYDLSVISQETTIVVCYWTKTAAQGAGTHSELTWAFMHFIPVLIVLDRGVDLPGWAHGCASEIYDNFDDLLEGLKESA